MTDSSEHHGLILRLAYDLCGSWADAEDVAQTVHMRWLAAQGVDNPRAYLARMTVNAALDLVQRRDYAGPILPGPLPDAPAADVGLDEAVEVELAFGVVLQSLSPLERCVFLLHKVFGFSHLEIAQILDRTPDAVRQVAHRASRHVQQRQPRYPTTEAEVQRVTDRFLESVKGGDLQALMNLLAPDVVLLADGGGRRTAAAHPIHGRSSVARFITGLADKHLARLQIVPSVINRTPVWVLHDDSGGIDQLMWLRVDQGLVTQVLALRDPLKLASLGAATPTALAQASGPRSRA